MSEFRESVGRSALPSLACKLILSTALIGAMGSIGAKADGLTPRQLQLIAKYHIAKADQADMFGAVAVTKDTSTVEAVAAPPKQYSKPAIKVPAPPSGTGLEISVGTIGLKRYSTHGIIATPPTGTPGTLITGDNFDFGRGFGPDIALRWKFNPDWSIQGRYFDSTSDATYNVPSVTTYRSAGIGVTILGGGSIDSSFSSQLGSGELNVVRDVVPGLSVLAGYRHFALNDHLRDSLASTGLNLGTWDEENRLDGGQLGLNFGFQAPSLPLEFNAALKGGVYNNYATNKATSQVVSKAVDNGSTTAYSGEIDLTATYYINDRFSITAGYSSLWLNNVALSDTQAQATVQAAGGTKSPLNYTNAHYDAFTLGGTIHF